MSEHSDAKLARLFDQYLSGSSALAKSDEELAELSGLVDELRQLAKPSTADDEAVLMGKYEVRDCLGCGGQSAALLAFDHELRRHVVLKLYHRTQSESDRAQVFEEGRRLAQVVSPHVAQCYGVEQEGSVPYLVLEYVPGRALDEDGRSWSREEVRHILDDLLAGMEDIHNAGLLHCDLKPSNVMITPDDHAKIIDFGFSTDMLYVDSHGGTLAYAAPEQLDPQLPVDRTTDIFGLGGILYYLLSGSAPFTSETVEGTRKRVVGGQYNPLDVAELQHRSLADLVPICERCLAADKEDRYASVTEIRYELEQVFSPPSRFRRLALATSLVAAMLLVAGLLIFRPFDRNQSASNTPPGNDEQEGVTRLDPPPPLFDVLREKDLIRDYNISLTLPDAKLEKGVSTFVAGKPMRMEISADRDTFVRVFCVEKNAVTEILPNRDYKRNWVQAETIHAFPDGQCEAIFTESSGPEYLYLLASPSQIKLAAAVGELDGKLIHDPQEMTKKWRGLRGIKINSRAKVSELLIPIFVHPAPKQEANIASVEKELPSELDDCGEGQDKSQEPQKNSPKEENPAQDANASDADDAAAARTARRIARIYLAGRTVSPEMLPRVEQAMKYAIAKKDRRLQVITLLSFERFYSFMHRYEEALDYARQAARLVKGTDLEKEWLARCQFAIGVEATRAGLFDEGERQLKAAMQGFIKHGDANDRGLTWIELGYRLAAVGDTGSAIRHYHQGLKLVTGHGGEADARMDLAQVLLRHGDTTAAIQQLEKARQVDRKVEIQARSFMESGFVYTSLGNREKANECFQKCIKQLTEMLTGLGREDWPSHHHMGIAFLAMGRPKEALPHIKRAISNMPEFAVNKGQRLLAVAYRQTGQHKESEKVLAGTIAFAKQKHRYREMAEILVERAGGRHSRKDFVGAAADLEHAIQLRSEHYGSNAYTMTATEAAVFAHGMQENVMRLLKVFSENRKHNARQAYEAIWHTYGQNMKVARRNRSVLNQLVQRDPEAAAIHARLLNLCRMIVYAAGDESQTAKLKQLKQVTERKLARLVSARSDLGTPEASLQDFAAQLAPDEAYVHILARYSSSIMPQMLDRRPREFQGFFEAFVIRPDVQAPKGYTVQWLSLGPSKPIERLVSQWNAEIKDRCNTPLDTPLAWYRGVKTGPSRKTTKAPTSEPTEKALRKLVWEPLEKHLQGCRRIIITPDGILARLPWIALPGKKSGQFLLHDYSISTLGHGEELVRSRQRAAESKLAKNSKLLSVGGIDYGPAGSSEQAFSRIDGTIQEVTDINRLWGTEQVTTLNNKAATQTAILTAIRDASYFHLATHGHYELPQFASDSASDTRQARLNSTNPMQAVVGTQLPTFTRTGLVLSNANQDREGLWTGEEIANLVDLHHLELVTLSTCHSANGPISNWGGTYSLQQAFSLAGAKSVVASLWPVHDDVTRQLMVLFYKNLKNGESKSDALRNAQLELLKNPKKYLTLNAPKKGQALSPHLWASWQLYGDSK